MINDSGIVIVIQGSYIKLSQRFLAAGHVTWSQRLTAGQGNAQC